MESKLLTPEEVTNLKSLQTKRLQLTEQFGILEYNIQELNTLKENLKVSLKDLKDEEKAVGEGLQQKYGSGTINLEKGEFTSTPSA